MPKRRQWNGQRYEQINKAVNANITAMAQMSSNEIQARPFPLMEAINAATGEIMANGGIQGFVALPRDPRDDNAFGPMDPLRPEAIDLLDSDGRTEPRAWQYPVGWNLPGNGNRETPFAVLRAAAAGVGIIRRCIEARKKDVSDLRFVFAPSEDAINDAYQKNPAAGRLDAEQKLREELMPELMRLREFWMNPWRSKGWDFHQWCRAALEDVLVIDGVPIYPRRTYGGDVYDLELIDPTTIKPLLDTRGNQPLPPFPAFQQLLYGFPRGEWAATVEYDDQGNAILSNGFLSSEMMYYVSNPRTFSPYGLSPVEQALFDSRLYLQRQKWMIAEYDDGSTPLTWIETAAPSDGQQMTLTQQRLWEKAFNAKLAGNTRERVRAKVLPNGWKAMQMTSVDERYRPEYDLYLIKLLASHFGVTATRLGFGETNGLGGSGFSESQMAVTGELGLKPDTEVLTAIINKASCHFLGMDKRVAGIFVDPSEANSPDQAAVTVGQINSGQISINEARQLNGQSLLPFEEANKPFILGGPQGIIFLEGAQKAIELAQEQAKMAAETSALGTAGKLSLEEKKLEDGQSAREEDREFARETREAEAELEVKKAAEITAFRRWRAKPVNAGDQPRRPFLFKSVEPDDGYELLEGLSPSVVGFDGWEWVEEQDIEKAARKTAKVKTPFDYLSWNASPEGLKHPKGPNGRWVKVGSELHIALREEGERHAKASAPKLPSSDASTTVQPMNMKPRQIFADRPDQVMVDGKWHDPGKEPEHVSLIGSRDWTLRDPAGNKITSASGNTVLPVRSKPVTRPLDAFTIPKQETGTGKDKIGIFLPDGRDGHVVRRDGKVELLDSVTDEPLFTATSVPNLWRKISAHYGAPVKHEHEGTGKITQYGEVSDTGQAARARQARIDAAKAKASFLADVEEALINETDSAALRRMVEQSVRQNKLEDDPVAGHVQLNMDYGAVNIAASAWGLRRIDEGSGFDRARHEAVGEKLRDGQLAELVRPGFTFRDGDEEVTLSRAVVDARVTEPKERPVMNLFTGEGFAEWKAEAEAFIAANTPKPITDVRGRIWDHEEKGLFVMRVAPGEPGSAMTADMIANIKPLDIDTARVELDKLKTFKANDTPLWRPTPIGEKIKEPTKAERANIKAHQFANARIPILERDIAHWEATQGARQLDKPGIDSAGFVTSAMNAHSLGRGDMVIIHGVASNVVLTERHGSVVTVTLQDGRILNLGVNEPVRRVHGGNLRKAAVPDDGPGDADPKAQEPVAAPPPAPDSRWPGWLLDTAIASLWATALLQAMPGLPTGMLLRLFKRLAAAWPQGLPKWGEMGRQERAGVASRVVWELRQDGWPERITEAIEPAIRGMHVEGHLVGQQVGQAVADATLDGLDIRNPADGVALQLSIDWSGWRPGYPEAAELLIEPGGLERLLRESGIVSRRLTEGRLNQIGRIIGEGLVDGLAPRTIGQRLNELFHDPDWAYMTALTETNRAMSAASVLQYRAAGMLYKGWMDAHDQRVCPVCHNNAVHPDGRPRIVPIDEMFPSGDPWPPGHPRCRCAPIPVLNSMVPTPPAREAP